MSQNPLLIPPDLASRLLLAQATNTGPASTEAQAAEIVKAMYGAYNYNQLQQLQAGLGLLTNNPEATATILQQVAAPAPAPAPAPTAAPTQVQAAAPAAVPSAFNPFLFGQTPLATGISNQDAAMAQAHTSSEIRERDRDTDAEPAHQRARHQYRDPEKRREQNRQASQRARLRARQREEQVVVLQQQLQKMIGEMSSMKAELDDAKKKVECGQKVESWQNNRGHSSRNSRMLNTL